MAKLPAMLIDSVHHGKPGPSRASMIWPIRWRQPAPIAPPTMTGKREFMAPALAGNDQEAKHVHRYSSGGVGAATGGIAYFLSLPPRLASATGASALRVDEEDNTCPICTIHDPATPHN